MTEGKTMAKISAQQMANEILDRLNTPELRYSWTGVEDLVGPIFKAHGWKHTGNHLNQSRIILRKMEAAGLVERRGIKAWEFQISEKARTSGWDRANPLPIREEQPQREDDETEDQPSIEAAVQNFEKTEANMPAEAFKEISELRGRIRLLENANKALTEDLQLKETRLDQIEKMAVAASTMRTLKIEKYDDPKPLILKDVVLPSYFDTMLDLAKRRKNILLVGPAGCGKTTAAGLLAKTMRMAFGKIGGCGGLTESHLLGRYNPLEKDAKKYVPSEFVTRFENGGVMLIDELDGADQNVLLALNPALDRSGELPLMNRPGKPVAKRHKDFICIATANTFGTGANRMYAGRNQLDASTLSRFQIGIIECDYDKNVERSICQDTELLERLWEIRRKASESILRRVIDTRFVEDAWDMKSHGWTNDKIIGQLLQGWSRDERQKVGEYHTAI